MAEHIMIVKELPYEEAAFDFDLEMVHECRNHAGVETIVGQPRALRSLRMGFALLENGYNIFVSGNTGSGRLEAVKQTAQPFRSDVSLLKDIVYVYNFQQPDSPSPYFLIR